MISLRYSRRTSAGFETEIDLDLPETGITVLFGPSGSGKTTMLRAVAGLENLADARISIGSETLQDADTFVPTHERRLGYVFQEASLFPHLTVEENVF